MRGPARLMALLAVAAATQVAAASDRFVPDGSRFRGGQRPPGACPTKRCAACSPHGAPIPTAERQHGGARGRLHRSRAHACASPCISAAPKRCSRRVRTRPGAGATLRRLYARGPAVSPRISRGRGVARRRPARGSTRCRRARRCAPRCAWCAAISPGARGDCAQLVAGGGAVSPIGFACLAEALAGSGPARSRAGIARSHAADPPNAHRRPASARLSAGHACRAARTQRRPRRRDRRLPRGADARAARRFDSRRARRRARGARRCARTRARCWPSTNPACALLVRSAGAGRGRERARLAARAQRAGSSSRPRAAMRMHYREAAMLALRRWEMPRWRSTRRDGISRCRGRLPDVRVLARAARAARRCRGPAVAAPSGCGRRDTAIRSPKTFSAPAARS